MTVTVFGAASAQLFRVTRRTISTRFFCCVCFFVLGADRDRGPHLFQLHVFVCCLLLVQLFPTMDLLDLSSDDLEDARSDALAVVADVSADIHDIVAEVGFIMSFHV